MRGIIDELCMIQDDLDITSDCRDTALVDFVGNDNNTNTLANHAPDSIIKDFNRENFSRAILPDFIFPEKKWGYMVTEHNYFSFIALI